MNDIFQFHEHLTSRYNDFSQGFNIIREDDIKSVVHKFLNEQKKFCPEPLIQLNMNYEKGHNVHELVINGTLHPDCERLFVFGEEKTPLTLHRHQQEAITYAQERHNYVVTTGTGSGKSLTFIIPIIDAVLRARAKSTTRKTRAIIIYPMNALANSQEKEFKKFLDNAEDLGISVGRYTGQESPEARKELANNPPDILLTNYMMLEYLLTRSAKDTDRKVIANCQDLSFLALDELHTYRGRQGADVALLVRRLRITTNSHNMICVGTSATMSSAEDATERRKAVADVAAKLFGAPFLPEHIIEESLLRVTNTRLSDSELPALLTEYLHSNYTFGWTDNDPDLLDNPLAIWVERTMGTTWDGKHELRRATPVTISTHAEQLAAIAGISKDDAKQVLQNFLQAASGVKINNRTPFAFKLHQFISGPGAVSVSLEPPGKRFITLESQTYVPARNDRARLFTAYFCSECGQSHIPAWYNKKTKHYQPRNIDESIIGDEQLSQLEACILTPADSGNEAEPHVFDPDDLTTLPESWLEEKKSGYAIKNEKSAHKPILVQVNALGNTTPTSSSPCFDFYKTYYNFPYCVHCGTPFEMQGKVTNRIYGLSIEGRSSASTVLMLSALNLMQEEIRNSTNEAYKEELRKVHKILGFTDNRQDAALQAGHFNDFVHIAVLRAGLIKALQNADKPLSESQLICELQKTLGLDKIFERGNAAPYEHKVYVLANPNAKGNFLDNAAAAMRFYLGYSLITEQRYGWKRNNPNLEQLNVLQITYLDIEEIAKDDRISASYPAWRNLSADSQLTILTTLFNSMRHKLCIDCDYLRQNKQQDYKSNARGCLTPLWSLPDKLKSFNYVSFNKRSRKPSIAHKQEHVSIAPQSGIGKALKKCLSGTIDHEFWTTNYPKANYYDFLLSIFTVSEEYGVTCKNDDGTWIINSRALRWSYSAAPERKLQENDFFLKLYENMAELLGKKEHGLFALEAQEHTAQVDNERREELEKRFRNDPLELNSGNNLLPLPLLFCSPTMELGVDISSLDIVYMRNVPPTPANYAQRSGRAGRSGRAALALTYCAAASPHDQWFFEKQHEMVCGMVNPPALDLSNRDMLESHLRAIWLHSASYQLDGAIVNILDTSLPDAPVLEEIREVLQNPAVIEKALPVAQSLVNDLISNFEYIPNEPEFDWLRDPHFCEHCLKDAWRLFDESFANWRELYFGTIEQMNACNKITTASAGFTQSERDAAQRRYTDAYHQNRLLIKGKDEKNKVSSNNELYSYRYLASQGFMPGYDFPRLPLLAWIPGRNGDPDTTKPLSRPRFLALSEFGPLSLIYHQGTTYEVHKIKLSSKHNLVGKKLPVSKIQVCAQCGHSVFVDPAGVSLDVCEHCHAELNESSCAINSLYKVETVETRRKEQINAMMEERQNLGYDLQTCYRFAFASNRLNYVERFICRNNDVDKSLGIFTYGPSATLWRINKGWRRRSDPKSFGFIINPTTGEWSSEGNTRDNNPSVDDTQSLTGLKQHIVPYVEDRRNILIYQLPKHLQSITEAATLQAALAVGIVHTFQIESSEIIVEALPDRNNRQSLLLYEASEGGAGVLHQLIESPERMKMVAYNALKAMHYEQIDGQWLDSHRCKPETERCICACYRCLLSYRNQPDHSKIDRSNEHVLSLLRGFANGIYTISKAVQAPSLEFAGVQSILTAGGLPPADEIDKELPGGIVASAYYTNSSLALFRDEVPPAAEMLTTLYGIICLPLPKTLTDDDIANISQYLS